MAVTFDEVFAAGTGQNPYPYQRRLAKEGLPDVLEVPTGGGKTAALFFGWLWRRRFADEEIRSATPRRLVFAQPMRTLTDQTAASVREWLGRLEAAGLMDAGSAPGVHELMGGAYTTERQSSWRMAMPEDSVVVGTVDAVVSRQLLRGYGATRTAYPIEAALVLNGAHVVVDEVQLAEQATATARQVAAFQRSERLRGTAEPTGLTCMSATLSERALDTVDHRFDPTTVVGVGEVEGELAQRLTAAKEICEITAVKPAEITQCVVESHRPGSFTLAIVNTVDAAVDLYTRLVKNRALGEVSLHLVHSRFRPVERGGVMRRILEDAEEGRDMIVVSTQAVEAGVDLDADTLVTEVSPWPSLCQRAGRCNRRGRKDDARLLWFEGSGKGPYAKEDLAATAAALRELEGVQVSGPELLGRDVPSDSPPLNFLRRKDFELLFDTTPDLSGQDLDVARYIRTTDEVSASIAWLPEVLTGAEGGLAVPAPEWRCPVPLSALRDFVKAHPRQVVAFDPVADRWRPVTAQDLRPGMVVLAPASIGGYDRELGFQPRQKKVQPVDPLPPASGEPAVTDQDSTRVEGSPAVESPLRLTTHLSDAAREAESLLRELGAACPEGVAGAVVAAAAAHDVGKAHPEWQRFIHACMGEPSPAPGEAEVIAKSVRSRWVPGARLEHGLRHEFVSALALQTEQGEQWLTRRGIRGDRHALVRYLVAAHHGYVRRMAPNPLVEGKSGEDRYWLGLQHGEAVPWFDPDTGRLDLEAGRTDFARGAARVAAQDGGEENKTWSSTAAGLLADLGPFWLLWLETVVRIADWRASAHPTQEENA